MAFLPPIRGGGVAVHPATRVSPTEDCPVLRRAGERDHRATSGWLHGAARPPPLRACTSWNGTSGGNQGLEENLDEACVRVVGHVLARLKDARVSRTRSAGKHLPRSGMARRTKVDRGAMDGRTRRLAGGGPAELNRPLLRQLIHRAPPRALAGPSSPRVTGCRWPSCTIAAAFL